jgi:hypothetical protein
LGDLQDDALYGCIKHPAEDPGTEKILDHNDESWHGLCGGQADGIMKDLASKDSVEQAPSG